MKTNNKIIRKLKSKKGGFKEIIYDNIGIAIVVVLIAIIFITFATETQNRASTTKTKYDNGIENEIDNTLDQAL